MARDIGLLVEGVQRIHEAIDRNCRARDVVVVPYFTLRDPWEQARLWRRSRSGARVAQECNRLQNLGMPWCAGVLEEVGPQPSGPWVTNAVPGMSWHQWGEAIDYYVANEDGSANWDGLSHGYFVLGEEAARLGAQSGLFWSRRDAPHVQLRRARVREIHSFLEIDRRMRARFQEAA